MELELELKLELKLLFFDLDPDLDLDEGFFDFQGVDLGFLPVALAAALSFRAPLDARLPLELVEPLRNVLAFPRLLSLGGH